MSIEKFKVLVERDITKSLCGVVLKKGEKRRLYEICIKYSISITYPNLFEDSIDYYLWGISKTGVGLIGTNIMNYLEDNNGKTFRNLDELEEYLKGEQ